MKRCTPLFSFLAWLSAGCLTPADLDVDIRDNAPTVNGQISTLPGRTYVQLGVTSLYNSQPDPESFANVRITDDLGIVYPMTETAPGRYTNDLLKAEAGRSYRLMVDTFDEETYISAWVATPPAPGSDSSYYRITQESYTDKDGGVRTGWFVKAYVDSKLSPESTYVRWEVEEVFKIAPTDFPDVFGDVPIPCYISQNADPQRIVLLNRLGVRVDALEGQLVATRPIDWTFKERHYLTVFQSSLTADACDYWQKVAKLAGQVGSIFDAPPAEIKGNITWSNRPGLRVFGYFQVVSESYSRFFLVPSDLPFTLPRHCEYDPFLSHSGYIPYECIEPNCQFLPGSTIIPPPWF
jgi:hypothetical protein